MQLLDKNVIDKNPLSMKSEIKLQNKILILYKKPKNINNLLNLKGLNSKSVG